MLIKILMLVFTLSCQLAMAKEVPLTFPEVNIIGSQVRTLQSEIVEQEYKLWISPPTNYNSTKKDYPVIYLLDAQWDFTLMISLYGQLRADGDIPNAFLVGITWGGENINVDGLRVRDFLPVFKHPKTGIHGADNFLTFFEKELIPFIDKEYRVSDQRTLIGSSFAGWFSLYTMFQRPDLFDGFLATAPTVELENDILLDLTDNFAERVKENNTKLYLAVGKKDGNKKGLDKALAFLKENNYDGLSYKSDFFDNMGHSSIKAFGNTRGLQYIFEKTEAKLTLAQMEKLVGRYKNVNSDDIATVSIKEERLVVAVDKQYEIPLKASSPSHFFFSNYNVEVVFDLYSQSTSMEIQFSGMTDKFERE